MMPSTAPAPGIFHDTAFGDVARFLSRGRLFPQPEDDPSFDVDAVCTSLEEGQTQHSSAAEEEKHADGEKGAGPRLASEPNPEVAPAPATPTHNVTWYGDDDVANPLNWSFTYKVFITFTICIMTTSIYMGSSIFAPAIPVFAEDRGTTPTVATLSISLFVWGYGMGPLLLSPITEVSFIGRNWPYIISIGIFVLLQIPTVLTDSVAGFLVLRFLSGFAGSPVLATGGATIGDIWGYGGGFANALGCWGYASAAGPVVGPIVGGFAVDANGWRWAIWPLFWASAGTWLWIFFLLPETSGATILSRRAARLRQRTGNSELVSEGDVHDRSLHASTLALNTLVRPFELMILEPVVLFNNLYIALVYGILYGFFEAFPIVFQEHHGFNAGLTGVSYLGILIAGALTLLGYCVWNNRFVSPKYASGTWKPEYRQLPVMLGGAALPVCLFWYGWTSFPSVHWISPILASSLYALSIYLLFQGILNYLAEMYPRWMASVFASNDVMRAAVGGAFPLFSTTMFNKLTVQGGCSLLGGLSLLMLPLPFLLYHYGPRLRAASPRAGGGA